VDKVLELIAKASPPFNALVDTGALITGYSNFEVAKQLLDRGLTWCDGVIFLDDDDRQQVLVRATGRVVSADQCGVSLEKRFAFYDQIHTTGMDIKHVVNATAVITLGKDMVFRDYVQGAYRMRGIGQGQKIHIFIIPEVRELIHRELRDCLFKCPPAQPDHARSRPTNPDGGEGPEGEPLEVKEFDHVLENVVAWLIVNSLRSEQTQWTMLCMQNIGNLYRKNAFKCLTKYMHCFIESSVSASVAKQMIEDANDTHTGFGAVNNTLSIVPVQYEVTPSKVVKALSEDSFVASLDKRQSLDMFNESIDFALDSGVPDPVPFGDRLKAMLEANEGFLLPQQHEVGNKLLQDVGQFATQEGGSANRLDTEQEREQEQEQEKEVEARRDQQIEVEKFVDREYSRQEEVQRPWPFSMLAKHIPSGSGSLNQDDEHPFYKLKDFKLRHQEPLEFDDSLYISSNYFNPNWMGLRRVKNVVMVLEFAPTTDPKDFRLKTAEEYSSSLSLTAEQEFALKKAHDLLSFHAISEGFSGVMNRRDIKNAVVALTDINEPSELLIDSIISRFCKPSDTGGSRSEKPGMDLVQFKSLLMSGMLHPVHKGRYWVALSLAEAETIRRILHLRNRGDNQAIISNASTELALRHSPICGSGSKTGDGGVIFDASWGWQTNAGHVADVSKNSLVVGGVGDTGATMYEAAVAHNSFRFFDCDMHFSEPALNILVRVLRSRYDGYMKFYCDVSESVNIPSVQHW
jgi:hypothetical protein